MSNKTYTTWWIASKEQLEDVQLRDQLIVEAQKKPLASRNLCNALVGGLYANYARVVKDLTTCLDQYTQVQKRVTMKKLVDAAVIRLHELKEELVKCNMAEIYYIDGNLIELKLVPQEIEILDPDFVLERSTDIEDNWVNIQKGEKIYTDPDEEPPVEVHEEEKVEEEKKENKEDKHKKRRESVGVRKKVVTLEDLERQKQAERVTDAVVLIQSHERARQERLYYGDLNNRRKLRTKAMSGELPPDAPLEVQEAATLMIQKVAKGFAERLHQKRREIDRRLLIGMTEPSWKSRAVFDEFEKNTEHRRAVRKQNVRDYISANMNEKERILRVVAPGLMEDITDEIREWLYKFYKEAMDFDKFPTEEEGGSILIVRGETMTPKQYLEEVEKRRLGKVDIGKDPKEEKKQLEAAKKAEAEKKKKEEDKMRKEAEALKKLEAKGGFMWNFQPTAATEVFKEGCKEYKKIWEQRPDSDNPGLKHYMDMVTDEKCYEVQLQVRKGVDELMRLELQMLLEALKIDRSRGIGKAPPKEKGKKGKKGKGKKSKDPTGHRSTEDLFQELVDNGIIHTYPKVRISEFKGDFSYCNWEKRVLDFDPPATLGDVREAVVMNCILPLGVGESMSKPRSVLIAGHRQSGKHLLANAVFYETQCVLFDLSPPILAGKYEGAEGQKMLVHLINKMSRILQPSVIFIDGGEKPFYKKIPAEEQALNPKQIGKQLFKGIVKPITPEDKVLVLAISKKPFDGSAAGLKKAYERVILIPRTDYGSLYMYWRELLMPYHGIDRNVSVSELARFTLTYPLPVIKTAVEKIMTPSRIIQLKEKPFDAHEVVEALLDMPGPITDKEWAKFSKWFNSTLPQKKRTMYMKIAEINRENEAKQAEKEKKKK